jgi:hypothetical protein
VDVNFPVKTSAKDSLEKIIHENQSYKSNNHRGIFFCNPINFLCRSFESKEVVGVMGCGTGGNELDGSTDFIIANKINKIKTSPLPNEKLVQSRSTK